MNRPHGYARYKLDGCRCYPCGWAVAQYNDARDHAIRRGQWHPYMDAEPVRQHIRNLQECGLGLRSIAVAAGVDRKRLQAVLNGRPERGTPPQAQVRPALATAVLAVEPSPDNLPDATVINAVGTTRRLQALVAAGWPQHYLAIRLHMTDSNFSATLRRDRVMVRTARAARSLYDELWRADPHEFGVDNQAYSRARNHAASRRWAPVNCWDEDTIDNPATFPEWTGMCGRPEGSYIHERIGVPLCPPCLEARRAHNRQRYAEKKSLSVMEATG
ncbi:hypothetical protein IPZ58_07785 [Streptomyces roseoverticillatus]|uniref:hypothetical protein n=1 Tax=Streptomyces roseoverticillatus TaxID=66429 RepID=UPI001F32F2CC|nr:hypothetical protein [Streptomyces roseoverticillatus]MCF3101479.1 hypothetical protein [Streptomyces roseoverticillatus]